MFLLHITSIIPLRIALIRKLSKFAELELEKDDYRFNVEKIHTNLTKIVMDCGKGWMIMNYQRRSIEFPLPCLEELQGSIEI